MTKFVPFAFAAATLAFAGAANAQTPVAHATTATHTMVASKTTTKTTKPAAASSRMVTAKTSTGKTVTYNCSKAGNANKKACKG